MKIKDFEIAVTISGSDVIWVAEQVVRSSIFTISDDVRKAVNLSNNRAIKKFAKEVARQPSFKKEFEKHFQAAGVSYMDSTPNTWKIPLLQKKRAEVEKMKDAIAKERVEKNEENDSMLDEAIETLNKLGFDVVKRTR